MGEGQFLSKYTCSVVRKRGDISPEIIGCVYSPGRCNGD